MRRGDVETLLGTPSMTGSFESDVWYYVGETRQRVAFYEPEVVAREVLALTFDDSGQLKDVARFDLDDGQRITFVKRTTPTAGDDLTILRQLVGNLGKFNKDGGGGGR